MKIAAFLYLIGSYFQLLLVPCALAAVDEPLRDSAQLVRPLPQVVERAAKAKVLIADYDLLRHDFPKLGKFSPAEIDQWLIDNAGYLSEGQVKWAKPQLSDPIPVDRESLKKKNRALRPEGYGRALVYEVDGGLLDVKGSGAVSPQVKSHMTGLFGTGESLREFLYEKKVQEIFEHSGLPQKTLGCYAVIDWGFDLTEKDGKKTPAGAIIRQAGARNSAEQLKRANIFMSDARATVLEKVLHAYGIGSSGESWASGVSAANLQGTKDGALFDFGAFTTQAFFSNPVYRYEDAVELSRANPPKGIQPLIPGGKTIPQPEKDLALPPSKWGSHGGGLTPYVDHLKDSAEQIVKDWRQGKASLQDIHNFVQDRLKDRILPPAKAGWFAAEHGAELPCEIQYAAIPVKKLQPRPGRKP